MREGNLRDWWTPADSVTSRSKPKRRAEQYNGYIQVDTFHVNGRLTLGENIADYGGVAHRVRRAAARAPAQRPPGTDRRLHPEQRFFIAYAQSCRAHTRPGEAAHSRDGRSRTRRRSGA